MHSCYDAYVVYGIMESNRGIALSREWLEDYDIEMSHCASDVVRNYMGNAVYGYIVTLCEETGQARATETQKESVERLHTLLCEYCTKNGYDLPRIGYHLVVSGDYETEHYEYTPDSD